MIGAYADRAGRRAALTLTLLLMAFGSGLVALTPSYAQIGLAAPIILVVARLIQGFSAGGEVGAATTYLLESAPRGKRAAATAWQARSQQLAVFVGSLTGLVLAAGLSRDQLYTWGWRVPFLLGVLIAPVGLYVRRQLPETVAGQRAHDSGAAVLVDLARHHALSIVLVSGSSTSNAYSISRSISSSSSVGHPWAGRRHRITTKVTKVTGRTRSQVTTTATTRDGRGGPWQVRLLFVRASRITT